MKYTIKIILDRIYFYKIYYKNIIKKLFSDDIDFNDLFYMASKTLTYRYHNDLNPFMQYIQMLNILQQPL